MFFALFSIWGGSKMQQTAEKSKFFLGTALGGISCFRVTQLKVIFYGVFRKWVQKKILEEPILSTLSLLNSSLWAKGFSSNFAAHKDGPENIDIFTDFFCLYFWSFDWKWFWTETQNRHFQHCQSNFKVF